MSGMIRKLVLILFIAGAVCQALAADNRKALSSECSAVMQELRSLEYDLFLYQGFFAKDPQLLRDLNDSGHAFTEEMKARLGKLIDGEFGERFKTLEARAASLADKYEKAFVLAAITYDLYKVEFELKKDKRTALPLLEKADALAKEFLRSKRKIVEFYRLNGEIQNQFIIHKGGMSAIYFSTECRKSYQEALKIKRDDAHTMILMGLWYLFAPDIAGGSSEKALSLIRKSRETTTDPYILFLSYIWESLACSNALKNAEALAAVGQALAIAPGNTWALWVQSEIKAGRHPLNQMM